MWDTGSSLGEIMPLEKKALTCAMKPNRPYRMVFGGEDFSAALYSGPPFRFACSLTEHTNFVNCIRYSPSGDVFVSVSSDRQAIIYDGECGQLSDIVHTDSFMVMFAGATGEVQGKLNEADQHKGSIYHCSFSKDGMTHCLVHRNTTTPPAPTSKIATVVFSMCGCRHTCHLHRS